VRAFRLGGAFVLVVAAALVITAGAGADTTSEAHIPLTEPFDNTCAPGEAGVILGEMHALVSNTETHSTIQANWQFSGGVSTTGTRYEGNDVGSIVLSAPKGVFTIEIDDNYELVSQSATPNLIVRMRVVLTFDPTTRTSLVDDRSRIDCSGS
jgi:hypothetical protein